MSAATAARRRWARQARAVRQRECRAARRSASEKYDCLTARCQSHETALRDFPTKPPSETERAAEPTARQRDLERDLEYQIERHGRADRGDTRSEERRV